MIGRDVVHQKNLHWKSTINNYLTSELNRFKSVIRIYSQLTNQRVIWSMVKNGILILWTKLVSFQLMFKILLLKLWTFLTFISNCLSLAKYKSGSLKLWLKLYLFKNTLSNLSVYIQFVIAATKYYDYQF